MSILVYNGQSIEQRSIDGFVNATQMAKPFDKKVNDFMRLKSTTELLEGLAGETGIPVSSIAVVQHGNETWIHPLLAIEFGGWLNVGFKIWCLKNIQVLMEEGEVSIKPEPIRQLPQRDATELSLTAVRIETVNNMTLRQLLRDELIDELSVKRGIKQLAAAPKEYTTVKVRARELGYSTTEIGNGTALGKFVSKLVPTAFSERVGKYAVKHYEVNDQLDTAIKSYFGMKRAMA
jgi:hypothetical protein